MVGGRGIGKVVGCHHNGVTCGALTGEHGADVIRRRNVETGGWLVEQQDSRSLRQPLGDEGALPLTARQLGEVSVGEMTEAKAVDGLVHMLSVGARQPTDRAALGGAAKRDDLANGDGEVGWRTLSLGHIRDAPSDSRWAPAVDEQGATTRFEDARDGVEQG